jgi:hypothetical protein
MQQSPAGTMLPFENREANAGLPATAKLHGKTLERPLSRKKQRFLDRLYANCSLQDKKELSPLLS